MKDLKFNCIKCGSDKFEIIGNATQIPLLSKPILWKTIRFEIRCADCKKPIHTFYDKDLIP